MAALAVLEEWLKDISAKDYKSVQESNHQTSNKHKNVSSFKPLDLNTRECVKCKEDDDEYKEVLYKNGNEYFGHIVDNEPSGMGQVNLENGNIINGNFVRGKLEGIAKEIIPSESFWTETFYVGGIPSGVFRKFRIDGILQVFGFYQDGTRIGNWLKAEDGRTYLLGGMDDQGEMHGEGVAYLYPNLSTAILGQFNHGKLVKGNYRVVGEAEVREGGMVHLTFTEAVGGEVTYDPSTFMRISRTPLLEDEYERETVYVDMSVVEGAGEGLFARRNIPELGLVAIFNGFRIKKFVTKLVRPGDDEWSDYRLTLDKSTDLDISAEYESTAAYCASLAHKACHSFGSKNAAFKEFYHPRFGHCMSVVALRELVAGEEVFVSYNYEVMVAPDWYRILWFHHLRQEKGWSEERIGEWVRRQETKWGYSLEIPSINEP